ncbi:MFS transporter [Nocardia sp. bgisy118]|uniref:MFS transporter n=1 Tax=Nocardia sp. bgisy118 TaxID=3413786 RepID=UPI003F4A6470
MSIFMLLLDVTIVATALAELQVSFDASLDDLQWVIDGYTLPIAGLLLIAATIGDRIGRRRLFLIGSVLFTASSAGCAMAPNILALNVVRGAQGAGAAVLFGVALPIIGATFPEGRRRAVAVAVYGAVVAGAAAMGPLIGGALVTSAGWRSIFLVNLPVGVLAIALTCRYMEESRDREPRSTDWVGAGAISTALLAGVFGLIEGSRFGWTSPMILWSGALSLVALGGFVWWERRVAEPMLDMRLLAKPDFAALALVGVAVGGTVFAGINYLALYFVNTLMFSPFEAGVRALPLTLAAFAAAPPTAMFQHRIPLRWSLPIALALVSLGLFLCTGVNVNTEWTHFAPGSAVAGLGLGAATVIVSQRSLTHARGGRYGMATGTVFTARQVGTAIGVAGAGAVFSHVATESVESSLSGLRTSGVTIPAGRTAELTDALSSGIGQRVVDYLPEQFEFFAGTIGKIAVAASASGIDKVMWSGGFAAALFAAATFVLCRLPATESAAEKERQQ